MASHKFGSLKQEKKLGWVKNDLYGAHKTPLVLVFFWIKDKHQAIKAIFCLKSEQKSY